jgi:hypothetical protein
MTEHERGNAEEILATAVCVPMNLVANLADLLISKGIISRQEVVSLVRNLTPPSSEHSESQNLVRIMVEATAKRFED